MGNEDIKPLAKYSTILLSGAILCSAIVLANMTNQESRLIKKISTEEQNLLKIFSIEKFYQKQELFQKQEVPKYLCYK